MISSPNPTEVVTAALSYARSGWPIFPCQGKKPLTPHGFKNASLDPNQIRRWWGWWPDANIGLPTGVSSGVLVLDVDFPRGGLASLSALSREVGRLPRSCVSRTGCGWHYFYRTSSERLPSTTNLGGQGAYPGLDVKADGGYVVLPPSVHEPTGRTYRWLSTSPLLPYPQSLGDLLCIHNKSGGDGEVRERTPLSALTAFTPSPAQVGRTFMWAIANAREGNRNDLGFWLACRLVEAGVCEAEAERLMCAYAWQVGLSEGHPYTVQEALRSLESARR